MTAQTRAVIVNKSLLDSDMTKQLSSQAYRVRISENTLPHTCIFPQSSVAFMIVPLNEMVVGWRSEATCVLEPTIVHRIQKFIQLHRQRYLLVSAAVHGLCEQKVISSLQQRFFDARLPMVPVHNGEQCVEAMTDIAKVTFKPQLEVIRHQFNQLAEGTPSEDTVLRLLSHLPLTDHECLVVLDGCGSLSDIATATMDQLLDCSLEAETAQKIMEFFKQDLMNITV